VESGATTTPVPCWWDSELRPSRAFDDKPPGQKKKRKKERKEKKNTEREIRFLLRSSILLQEQLSLKAPHGPQKNTPLHSLAPDLRTTASSSSIDSASHFIPQHPTETFSLWTRVGQGTGEISAR
jgi:hypothetical protein